MHFERDEPISLAELKAALQDAKPGEATPNQVTVELLKARSEKP